MNFLADLHIFQCSGTVPDGPCSRSRTGVLSPVPQLFEQPEKKKESGGKRTMPDVNINLL